MDEKYIEELARKSMEIAREIPFDEGAWEQLSTQMDAAAAASGGAAIAGSALKAGLVKSLITYGIAASLLLAVGVLGWRLSEVSDKKKTLQTELTSLKLEDESRKAESQKLKFDNAQDQEILRLERNKFNKNNNTILNKSKKENIQEDVSNIAGLEQKLAQTQKENADLIDSKNHTIQNNELKIAKLHAALRQKQNELQAQLAVNESLQKSNERLTQLASQASPFSEQDKNDIVGENKIDIKKEQQSKGVQSVDIQTVTRLAAAPLSLKLKVIEAALLADVEVLPLSKRPKEFKRLSFGYHIDKVKLNTDTKSGSTIGGTATAETKGFKAEWRILPALSLSLGAESRKDSYLFMQNRRPPLTNDDKLEPREPGHNRLRTNVNLYSTDFPIALKYNFFPRSIVSPCLQAGIIFSQSERQQASVVFRRPHRPGTPPPPSYRVEHTAEERKLYLSAYQIGAGVDLQILKFLTLQASVSSDQRINVFRPRFERKGEQQTQLAILYRF